MKWQVYLAPLGAFLLSLALSGLTAPRQAPARCHRPNNLKGHSDVVFILNGANIPAPKGPFQAGFVQTVHALSTETLKARERRAQDVSLSVYVHTRKDPVSFDGEQGATLAWEKINPHGPCCHECNANAKFKIRAGWRFRPIDPQEIATATVSVGGIDFPIFTLTSTLNYTDDNCVASGLAVTASVDVRFRVAYSHIPGLPDQVTENGVITSTRTVNRDPPVAENIERVNHPVRAQDDETQELELFKQANIRKFEKHVTLNATHTIPGIQATAANNCVATGGAEITPAGGAGRMRIWDYVEQGNGF